MLGVTLHQQTRNKNSRIHLINQNTMKKCRWCAWDSNLELQLTKDGRLNTNPLSYGGPHKS